MAGRWTRRQSEFSSSVAMVPVFRVLCRRVDLSCDRSCDTVFRRERQETVWGSYITHGARPAPLAAERRGCWFPDSPGGTRGAAEGGGGVLPKVLKCRLTP